MNVQEVGENLEIKMVGENGWEGLKNTYSEWNSIVREETKVRK